MHNRSTMMRAFAFDFPNDATALKQTDEYMFGRALLVAPVIEKGVTERTVYLPAATSWFDFFSSRRFAGGETVTADAPVSHIPVFARAGSIVPIGPVKPYADAPSTEPIELRVYPGANGSFALYDDAGDGFGYEKGEYSLVHLSWNDRGRSLSIATREGRGYPGMAPITEFKVVCGNNEGGAKTVGYSGKPVAVTLPACR